MRDEEETGALVLWALLCGLIILLILVGTVFASELRWQQGEPPPVGGWQVWSNLSGTPTLRATILPTMARRETLTPISPPWYPTPGPGTPEPTLSQWSREEPAVSGGEIVALKAVGAINNSTSGFSNVKQLDTATPSPTATASPSFTMTVSVTPTSSPSVTPTISQSPTRTFTLAPTQSPTTGHPSAPHIL